MDIPLIDRIRAIVDGLVDLEVPYAPEDSPWARGSVQHDARMMKIAQLCADLYEGDFCEIGTSRGATTSGLARIAVEHNRRVIGVDPYIAGTQNCDGSEYADFLKNTAQWRNIIDLIRLPSEHPDAIAQIKARPLCYAYVDGRHTYQNCSLDIQTVSHAKVVCVDDLWNPELRCAFWESPRPKYYHKLCHEGYLA